MKLIAWIGLCCLGLGSSVFAGNRHTYPETNNSVNQLVASDVKWTDGCEIEIVNRSYVDVRVFGVFDDGTTLEPFNIYSFESPHYISLFYNGYCHAGMDLDMDTIRGYHVYSGYTRRGSTVLLLPDSLNQAKSVVRVS